MGKLLAAQVRGLKYMALPERQEWLHMSAL